MNRVVGKRNTGNFVAIHYNDDNDHRKDKITNYQDRCLMNEILLFKESCFVIKMMKKEKKRNKEK